MVGSRETMTNTPQRDLKKEFVSFMADVEGTQQLVKDHESETRGPQKDALLKKILS